MKLPNSDRYVSGGIVPGAIFINEDGVKMIHLGDNDIMELEKYKASIKKYK